MTGMAFRVAGKGSKHLLSRYGRKRAAQVSAVLALVALLGLLLLPGRPATVNLLAAPPEQGSPQFEALRAKAEANGTVRVIVGLNVAAQPEGKLAGAGAVQAQRQAIAAAQQSVLRQMAGTNTAPVVNFKYIPFMTLTVDAAALAKLNALPETATLEEDVAVPPTLASAIPVIGADHAWAAGYTGQGQTVAILDTGVEKTHDFFTTGGNKVVSEACYSNAGGLGGATSVCPGGVFSSTAVGSGVDCTAATAGFPDAQDGCSHGTHVAGIVAGNDGGANIGVAKDADLIAVQVFSMFTGPVECGVGHASCVKTFTTDQLLGLQRVYELRTSYTIAAVNMSLGGGKYTAVCDAGEPVRKVAMDLLRSVGIATIVATGNDGYTDGMGAPACISTAVSVGATDDDDNVADFSNIVDFIDLLAPGVAIDSSVPGNAVESKQGTSMATPMVAGAWAVMKQFTPTATITDVLAAFKATGTPVDDNRFLGTVTGMPRINLDRAINQSSPGLTVDKLAPDFVLSGRPLTYTITVFNYTGQTATGVTITDTVPPSVTLDLTSLSGDASAGGSGPGSLITWATGQNLAVNQGLTRTFVVTVDAGIVNGGQIANTAYASAGGMDDTRHGTATTTINRLVQCGFSDGFESGALSDYWSTHATNDGRVRVTTTITDGDSEVFAPHSGSYHAVLDDSVDGGNSSEAGIILTLDLSGQTDVTLDFWWLENNDENNSQDGVFISDDYGANWSQALSFNNGLQTYRNDVIDIDAAASGSSLTLNDHFQIKFQGYDNWPFEGNDGYAIDDVQITCVGPDLSIVKTVQTANSPAQRNDPVTYTIVVANAGTVDATGVRITDTLPTYINGANLDRTVTVTAGRSVTFTINAAVAANAPFDAVITNTAHYSHTSGSGQSSAAFTVEAGSIVPNLAITKTVALTNGLAHRSDPLTYTIVVANRSGIDAANVRITDTLPTYINGANLDRTATVTAGRSVTFTLNVTVDVNAPFGAVITNTAYYSHASGGGQSSAVFTVTEKNAGKWKVYLPIILIN